MKGWVYIITNKAMPGLIKIGYSSKDPENRAKELNSTASPHPHTVEFAVLVDGPKQVEQSIHLKLKDNHEAKEWFRYDAKYAAQILKDQENAIVTHGANLLLKAGGNLKKCGLCNRCRQFFLHYKGHNGRVLCGECNNAKYS